MSTCGDAPATGRLVVALEAILITKNEMFPLVLDACPSFLPTWELLQHDRKKSCDDALHDRAVEALTRHVTRMLRHCQMDAVSAIFALVERLLAEGEPNLQGSVRSLIQILQNQTRDTASAPQFRHLLGTRSAEHWDDFEKYLHASQMIFRWEKSRIGSFPQLNLESIKDQQLRDLLQHTYDVFKPD